MEDNLQYLSIVIAILLVAAIILQVKGTGAGLFGAAYATFRTRRGFERLLFRFTIALAVVFIAISLWAANIG